MTVESLQDRAELHLRVIRAAMERAGTYSAVSGAGGVLMGLVALVATWRASGLVGAEWVRVWLIAAAVAVPVGALSLVWKAGRAGVDLRVGSARRFVFTLAPPILAGAAVTAALLRVDAWSALPAAWLSLYGAATVAGGTLSVPPIPLMGTGFMLLGAVAAFAGPATGNLLLGAGFGFLHVVCGAWVWRRYGG